MTQIDPKSVHTRRPYKRPALTVIGDLARLTRTLRVTGNDDGGNNGQPHRTAH
ncbi:MAG: hypothetical protein ABSD80_12455 [Caulobacteraceae bacterium]|jgi:hypothetical protein